MDEVEGGLLAPQVLSDEQNEQKEKLVSAGSEALDAEDFDRALECYHRASVLDGADPKTWCLLGLTFANLEFPKEAWRSYKLALTADPDYLDALWYAGDFLFGMEDYQLAHVMLVRYVQLEEDEERRQDAEALLDEIKGHLPAELLVEADNEVDEGLELPDEDDELPEGFALDDEGNGDAADDEDGYDEDIDFEQSEAQSEEFVASVVLQLSGLGRSCQQCSSSLPVDAPYCLSCYAPQFYGD